MLTSSSEMLQKSNATIFTCLVLRESFTFNMNVNNKHFVSLLLLLNTLFSFCYYVEVLHVIMLIKLITDYIRCAYIVIRINRNNNYSEI